jgi:hypothetical protein
MCTGLGQHYAAGGLHLAAQESQPKVAIMGTMLRIIRGTTGKHPHGKIETAIRTTHCAKEEKVVIHINLTACNLQD